MKKLILLDPGHGGLKHGHYTTYPAKRYDVGFTQINEGVLNRAVSYLLQQRLDHKHIPVHIIPDVYEDTSLHARVYRANQLAREYQCFYLSIHHNAAESVQAHGAEFFTSYGETRSDTFAEYMGQEFQKLFPDRRLRVNTVNKDKLTKEANFRVLTGTICPAVLTEWAFMTNALEYEYISSYEGIVEQCRFLEGVIEYIYEVL